MKIAIIAALSEEFNAIKATLPTGKRLTIKERKAVQFSINGDEILLIQSGIGFRNGAKTAEFAVSYIKPDILLSIGFCGAILSELAVGDVIVAENISIADMPKRVVEDVPVRILNVLNKIEALHSDISGCRKICGGTFISTPAVTPKSELAELLSGRYHNPVVEMESGAIAIIAAENGIPLVGVRVITDISTHAIGFSLNDFYDRDLLRIKPLKVLRTLLKKPRIIPELICLSKNSSIATEILKELFPLLLLCLRTVPAADHG